MNNLNILTLKENIKQEFIALAYDLGYLDSVISLYNKYEETTNFNDILAKFNFHMAIKFKQNHIDIKQYLHHQPDLMDRYILGYVEAIIDETSLGSSFNNALNEEDIYPSFVGFTFEQNRTIENLLVKQIDSQIMLEEMA